MVILFTCFFSVCPGCVDTTELKKAFEKMNVHVTDKEVNLLLKRY